MVSLDDENIDFNILLDNIDAAIESERVYNLQNAAKIRAVSERGTTYEDFVNTVKGATLKPIDKKKDKLHCNPRDTWNPCAKESTDEPSIMEMLKTDTKTSAVKQNGI